MGDDVPARIDGGLEPRPDVLSLARRSDFRLGNAAISPSLRTIAGPDGTKTAEPRVMQVLLALADAKGAVLSRDDLLDICWQGRIVGDDAINRTISGLRRLAQDSGADFEIATVPRVGYRLTTRTGDIAAPQPFDNDARLFSISRRTALAGFAAVAGVAGTGAWLWQRRIGEENYRRQIEQARHALWIGDEFQPAVRTLEKITAEQPDNAEAWGLLAVARYSEAERVPKIDTAAAVERCENASRKALTLDPEQTDALYAQALLRSGLDDWLATERRLRRLLAFDPGHLGALESLTVLLQSVGRCAESRAMLERAVAIESAAPGLQFKRAFKFWIFGNIQQADRTIDRARQLWPRNEWVWSARLIIYAFTGRAKAGLAMLDDVPARPATLDPVAENIWRKGLQALDSQRQSDITGARHAVLESAPKGPANAGNGVMLLSAMGELDAAFAVAESLLLRRGAYIDDPRTSNDGRLINSQGWRRSQWLFIPATQNLRSDPRFVPLCRGLGLIDYWRRSGHMPDAFVRGALPAQA